MERAGALGLPRTERVEGWVSFAGIADFVGADDFVAGVGRFWVGPHADRAALTAASPVTHLDASDPPGWVVHGEADDVVSPAQAVNFAAAAQSSGAPVTVEVVDHGPRECRWHLPACGADRAAFESFLDTVSASAEGAHSASLADRESWPRGPLSLIRPPS